MRKAAGRMADADRYPLGIAAVALQVQPRPIEPEYPVSEQSQTDQRQQDCACRHGLDLLEHTGRSLRIRGCQRQISEKTVDNRAAEVAGAGKILDIGDPGHAVLLLSCFPV